MWILSRLWTGVVAAMAGMAAGMLLGIVGIMTIGLPVEFVSWIVLALGLFGFFIGVIVGNHKFSGKRSSRDKTKDRDIWIA